MAEGARTAYLRPGRRVAREVNVRWSVERDEDDPSRTQHVLEVDGDEPLGAVRADTGWGTFDFQLERDEFGMLPAEDRALLAGKQPRDAAVENLTSGLIDGGGLTTFELQDGD